MAKDPVHLYIGLYDDVEKADHDFDGLVALHRQGLVASFDAAVIERGEDGTPRIVHKKRTGHHILTGLGIGALLTVLTPFVAIPFAADRRRRRRSGAPRRGQPAEGRCGGTGRGARRQ